jgi:3-methyladenine DNA glycosylase AlkD
MSAGLADRIRAELALHADPVRAGQQQAYMKSAMPYRGLTAGELRAAVRPLLDDRAAFPATRDAWRQLILELWDRAEFREERYAALTVARDRHAKRFRADGALDLYEHLIRTGAWWDLVDEVATHLVRDELLADPAGVAPTIRAWSVAPDPWIRRTAILCQVGAKRRTDAGLLAAVIEPNLEGGIGSDGAGRQGFFIRKAIGWALRDYARNDAAWVTSFVADHRDRMAGLTIREALRRLPPGC